MERAFLLSVKGIDEMSEEIKTETVPEVAEVETSEATPEQPEEEEFDKDRAMATIKKLREIEKQAKAQEKELAKYKQAEDERKKAAMSEMERLKAERDELEEKYKATQRENQQRQIADEIGLPVEFAKRISGETPEEMKADAESMMAVMPKAKKPVLSMSNPVAGRLATETDEQKRARIFGPSTSGV